MDGDELGMVRALIMAIDDNTAAVRELALLCAALLAPPDPEAGQRQYRRRRAAETRRHLHDRDLDITVWRGDLMVIDRDPQRPTWRTVEGWLDREIREYDEELRELVRGSSS